MILALCSTGPEASDSLDPRFGRCSCFLYFNTETGAFRSEVNGAREEAGGAGTKAVQQLVKSGVAQIIAPDLGPQALDALQALKIPVFRQGDYAESRAVLEAWKEGRLEEQKKAAPGGMHRA